MHPLETYLNEIATLRGATKETSGYGVLQNLLNVVGQTLKPRVKYLIHPKNSGAGKQVAALLDTERPLTGVANGSVRPELKTIAVLSSTKNLSVTAGWGHAGQNGVTMPGKGKLETRSYSAEELASWTAPAERSGDGAFKSGVALRLPPQSILGQATHDVFLNPSSCWRNVPEKVWDYTIGGYQVIKKWLSYREFALLGRVLTPDEAREVTHMARRIAALILLQPELDNYYQRVKAATFDWKP